MVKGQLGDQKPLVDECKNGVTWVGFGIWRSIALRFTCTVLLCLTESNPNYRPQPNFN